MLLLSFTSAGKNILYTMYSDFDFNTLASLQYVCNYLFGPLMLLLVDKIIESFSFKKIFLISSFNLNIFLLGGLLVAKCQESCSVSLVETITVISSLIAGVLQTVFYVSFVAYINFMCNNSNRELFFGISFSFTSMSNILSNIIGYYLKQYFNLFTFYVIIVVISIILQALFFCMKDNQISTQKESRSIVKEIQYQFLSLYKEITFRSYCLFLGVLVFAGLMNSVIYLFLPVLVERLGFLGQDLYNKIFITFLITGIGQVIGGITAGKLSEKFKENNVLYFSFVVNFIGILLAQIGISEQSFSLVLVGCALIGYADSSISSLALIVITKQISTKIHAFAGFNLCQSIGFGLSSIWWAFFNKKSLTYDFSYLYITTSLALISFVVYNCHILREGKTKEKDDLIPQQ
ncbi:unnamed protein product (macronuclear) [Paramecium tetraurelia]|uniref:Major facilitator superfamily (MFS) profile domain-containing protein n=1 Tax=Paramecium tetraurelia TaxID=5888 RepID=A0CP39_PARTE|nr:uncharacterized protein GSPATT00008947001 [Paramecium tetraurelia]CAK72556.1 unnamed protein product [Paramecium tetraurelia]|eukprot:XP_001439953.1 hypothetical protein (macronuclear) [Paramecium tetraurelia strain d4-2]